MSIHFYVFLSWKCWGEFRLSFFLFNSNRSSPLKQIQLYAFRFLETKNWAQECPKRANQLKSRTNATRASSCTTCSMARAHSTSPMATSTLANGSRTSDRAKESCTLRMATGMRASSLTTSSMARESTTSRLVLSGLEPGETISLYNKVISSY